MIFAVQGNFLNTSALAFPWLHPAVAAVLVGARNVVELTADVEAARAAVPAGLWARLLDAGLLDPAVGSLSR